MIITPIPLSYLLARNDALKYIKSHFSPKEMLYLLDAYKLDLNGETLIKLTRGWWYSSKLIDTFNEAVRLALIIDKYVISNYITHHSFNTKTKILKYQLHELNIEKELNYANLELEFLSYYYREGYTIKEIEGSGYKIVEPYGTSHLVDLSYCNCINYLKSNNCLHMQLAKSYHQNLKLLRDVEYSFIG